MEQLKFRLLRANEIDARIGSVIQGYGVSLLLYKDARCDMTILDEAVGPLNWQRMHSRDNANCTVTLWDDQKRMWVSKEDVGTPSNTEAQKGLASDSFKRACTNWGIGRELYTSPRIFIKGEVEKLKKTRFSVKEIGYTETTREINKLVIINDKGAVVFAFAAGQVDVIEPEVTAQNIVQITPKEETEKPAEKVAPAAQVSRAQAVPATQAQEASEAQKILMTALSKLRKEFPGFNFKAVRGELIKEGKIKDIPSNELSPIEMKKLLVMIHERLSENNGGGGAA